MVKGKNRLLFLGLFMASLFSTSCVPYKKQVYFQFLEGMSTDTFAEYSQVRNDYKLQVDDIIDISITSPNSDAAALFSQDFRSGSSVNPQMLQGASGGDIYYLTGYIIDDSGYIELPTIGNILAAGNSVKEIKRTLEFELLKYFNSKNSFNVTVKLGGIRFSIMGEVSKPGRYVVLESRYNIYQALAQVGDLSVFANRSEVWLMRQENGNTRVYSIDLLSEKIMESPLYYIQPNDIIYVRPLKAKQYGVGATFLQNFNATISVLSTSLSLYLSYLVLVKD